MMRCDKTNQKPEKEMEHDMNLQSPQRVHGGFVENNAHEKNR